MAVAAYAYVTSLLHVLDQVQHPVRCRLLRNTKQIETLQEKVHFLQEFLEDHSPTKIEGMEDLMKQITEVAYEAEDIIDSHVAVQLRQEYEDKTEMNIGAAHGADHQLRESTIDITFPYKRARRFTRKKKIDSHVGADHQLGGGSEDETNEDMGLSLLFSEMNIGAESTTAIAFPSSFCQDIDKVIEKIDFHVGLSNTMDGRGRCRRTDGKKWRCSRNAVIDKKYCKQHLNRGGRNHSTPLIASSMSASVVGSGGGGVSANDHLSGTPNTINRSLGDKEIPKDKQTYSVLEQKPTVSVRAGSSILASRGKSTRVDMEFSSSSSFCQDIDKVIEKIDSIKEQLLTMVRAEGKAVQELQPPLVSVRAGSSTLLPSRRNNSTQVVGFDERLIQIMELLTGNQPNLQIIPIVGMGGIGKTTLARFAFENKCVVENFDVRVWFTISQEYSAHEILLGILSDIGIFGDLKSENLAKLGLRLYKYLFGRRYLIVMDDLWSTKGWDDFKLSFPNDVNGSRVMVTTRLKDVAATLGSHNTYTMDFLDKDNSWNLLCEKAFTQGSCSPHLEEIGKKIAKGCKGLPLAIVVIGGLLAKSNMTREYWEFVAGKVKMLVSSTNDEDCSKILSLSYNHLPIHLKPCFLYMGFFLEDCEIEVFDLIESWVNEGFLKPVRGKSLEQVADEYLKDLIDRNLILIRRRGDMGDITGCGVHDLLRELCKREALKERFLSVPKSQQSDFYVTGNDEIGRSKDIVGPRSAELFGSLVGHPNPHLVRLRFCGVREDMFYEKLPLYIKLRYLFLRTPHLDPLPLSTIIQLWKLQTLCILSVLHTLVLPSEIWEMPQLMHIIIHKDFYLPKVTRIERKDFIVLENLHTLVKIRDFRCTEDVVKRIPNLKELEIGYNYCERDSWSYYCLHNIANLRKLESLVLHKWKFTCGNIAFPYSLKKLVLYWCIIPWEDMTVIGSLPNLEVLKLGEAVKKYSMRTDEWDPVEDGFRQLKFLYVFSPHLRRWRAESIHFPKLEILQLRRMDELEEIPSGIGEIETLRKIEVEVCSSSVINSAKEIYEEQKSFENEDFQLIINFERYQN